MKARKQVETLPQLGHFLTYRLWEDALKLIGFQLELKATNQHFNTFSMFYYGRLGNSAGRVIEEQYFYGRIENNLFYGLEKEFLVIPYPVPKTNLGLRNYKFMTYPTRIVYYAVGLYLLKLSQEFVQGYCKQHKHIASFYGGRLLFDDNSGTPLCVNVSETLTPC